MDKVQISFWKKVKVRGLSTNNCLLTWNSKGSVNPALRPSQETGEMSESVLIHFIPFQIFVSHKLVHSPRHCWAWWIQLLNRNCCITADMGLVVILTVYCLTVIGHMSKHWTNSTFAGYSSIIFTRSWHRWRRGLVVESALRLAWNSITTHWGG